MNTGRFVKIGKQVLIIGDSNTVPDQTQSKQTYLLKHSQAKHGSLNKLTSLPLMQQ